MIESTPNLSASRGDNGLPVVGVGASAGGLEALEMFFAACGPIARCAFVVVQHLSASQQSLLPELLQRCTTLPVGAAAHGEHPRAGQVHVMPPGCELRLAQGVFHLDHVQEGHKSRLPIDAFFASVAEELGELAVGVVLSGMVADGTEGLRRIKECAGSAFVQSLASAEFDSMPRSAIEAGLADVVAEPADLPGRFAAHLAHTSLAEEGDGSAHADSSADGRDASPRAIVTRQRGSSWSAS